MAPTAEPTLGSMDDLMVLAIAQEQEAARRYRDLAMAMDRFGSAPTAALFRRLAEMEQGHAGVIAAWASACGSDDRGGAAEGASVPQTLGSGEGGDHDPNLSASTLLTPYRALELAVHNEERAFSFLTHLAAQAATEPIRAAAETLALEELKHITLLRAERRRAYRAERPERDRWRAEVAAGAAVFSTFAAVAARRLLEAATLHDRLSALLHQAGADDPAEVLAGLAAAERDDAARFGPPAAEPGPVAFGETAPPLVQALRPVEALADWVLAVADRTPVEAVLAAAQALAGRTVTRLQTLRGTAGQD